VNVLPWTARSPDLNPIENLWSIRTRHVYANGRQFDNVRDLTAALYEAWDAIEMKVLTTLIESMPRRCKECSNWQIPDKFRKSPIEPHW
jgi:hypothetical protein